MAKLIISILLLGSILIFSCSDISINREIPMRVKYISGAIRIESLDSMYKVGDTIVTSNGTRVIIEKSISIKHQ